MKEYIPVATYEDYEKAEKIGLTKRQVDVRIYRGWSIERAISTPLQKKKVHYQDWKELCDRNGITRSSFYARIFRKGMTPEEAATTPKMRNRKKVK